MTVAIAVARQHSNGDRPVDYRIKRQPHLLARIVVQRGCEVALAFDAGIAYRFDHGDLGASTVNSRLAVDAGNAAIDFHNDIGVRNGSVKHALGAAHVLKVDDRIPVYFAGLKTFLERKLCHHIGIGLAGDFCGIELEACEDADRFLFGDERQTQCRAFQRNAYICGRWSDGKVADDEGALGHINRRSGSIIRCATVEIGRDGHAVHGESAGRVAYGRHFSECVEPDIAKIHGQLEFLGQHFCALPEATDLAGPDGRRQREICQRPADDIAKRPIACLGREPERPELLCRINGKAPASGCCGDRWRFADELNAGRAQYLVAALHYQYFVDIDPLLRRHDVAAELHAGNGSAFAKHRRLPLGGIGDQFEPQRAGKTFIGVCRAQAADELGIEVPGDKRRGIEFDLVAFRHEAQVKREVAHNRASLPAEAQITAGAGQLDGWFARCAVYAERKFGNRVNDGIAGYRPLFLVKRPGPVAQIHP